MREKILISAVFVACISNGATLGTMGRNSEVSTPSDYKASTIEIRTSSGAEFYTDIYEASSNVVDNCEVYFTGIFELTKGVRFPASGSVSNVLYIGIGSPIIKVNMSGFNTNGTYAYTGVQFAESSQDLTIDGISFYTTAESSYPNNYNYNVTASSTTNVTFKNCKFQHVNLRSTTTSEYFKNFVSVSDSACQNIRLDNCDFNTFSPNDSSGIGSTHLATHMGETSGPYVFFSRCRFMGDCENVEVASSNITASFADCRSSKKIDLNEWQAHSISWDIGPKEAESMLIRGSESLWLARYCDISSDHLIQSSVALGDDGIANYNYASVTRGIETIYTNSAGDIAVRDMKYTGYRQPSGTYYASRGSTYEGWLHLTEPSSGGYIYRSFRIASPGASIVGALVSIDIMAPASANNSYQAHYAPNYSTSAQFAYGTGGFPNDSSGFLEITISTNETVSAGDTLIFGTVQATASASSSGTIVQIGEFIGSSATWPSSGTAIDLVSGGTTNTLTATYQSTNCDMTKVSGVYFTATELWVWCKIWGGQVRYEAITRRDDV